MNATGQTPPHPHAPNWLRWLGHLAGKPAATGLELGTFRGESAEWMLDNIFTHPQSQYWCVDTFEGSAEHRLRGIDCSTLERDTRARLARFPNAHIERETSVYWLLSGIGPSDHDFIYIDAAHDARSVLRDAVLAFDLLAIGGIMIFDDYTWADMPDPLDRPRLAIDAFLTCYARQIVILEPRCSQIAVRKIQS